MSIYCVHAPGGGPEKYGGLSPGLHVARMSLNSRKGSMAAAGLGEGEKVGNDAVSWLVKGLEGPARKFVGNCEPLGILGQVLGPG